MVVGGTRRGGRQLALRSRYVDVGALRLHPTYGGRGGPPPPAASLSGRDGAKGRGGGDGTAPGNTAAVLGRLHPPAGTAFPWILRRPRAHDGRRLHRGAA